VVGLCFGVALKVGPERGIGDRDFANLLALREDDQPVGVAVQLASGDELPAKEVSDDREALVVCVRAL
jgi:hypothetical protein